MNRVITEDLLTVLKKPVLVTKMKSRVINSKKHFKSIMVKCIVKIYGQKMDDLEMKTNSSEMIIITW